MGDEEYVIPAVMKKDKDPKWFSSISSYRYIFGREYYSDRCLTIRTMHSIQHALGKTFEVSSINYFKKGLYIKSDHCEILVETDDYLSRVQVKVGAQKKFCDDNNKENIKRDSEEILWKTFHDIVFLKIVENNDSLPLIKRVLSWNGLNQGKDVWYPFENVIKHHDSKKTIIHHTALDDENPVHDEISSLLTKREIEVNTTILYFMSL